MHEMRHWRPVALAAPVHALLTRLSFTLEFNFALTVTNFKSTNVEMLSKLDVIDSVDINENQGHPRASRII